MYILDYSVFKIVLVDYIYILLYTVNIYYIYLFKHLFYI